MDLVESAGGARVAVRRQHHRDRRARVPDRLLRGEAPLRSGEEERQRVAAQPEQDRLRLGIAQPAVELQHPRAARSQNEAGVERADERRPPAPQLAHGGLQDGADGLFDQLGRRVPRRADRAHAAGVGAEVAVEQALVVARGRQRQDRLAVAEGDDGDLAPLEPLLDEELSAGPPKLVDCLRRLRAVARDDDALARRQPVDLHHAGAGGARMFAGRRPIFEDRRRRGGHGGGVHDLFCKGLRRLDARRGRQRPEAGDALPRHPVGEPVGERRLGAHHH